MNDYLILVINPGSTSTKIAIYKNEKPIIVETIKHTMKELLGFKRVTDQFNFRKELILEQIKRCGFDIETLDCIVARGGLLRPIPSGIYEIDNLMLEDLNANYLGEHASNLGGLIAYDLAKSIPIRKAYIADPVVVDELWDIARISGHPKIPRVSIFHALNHKAVARAYANSLGKDYNQLNLIIVHLGGGISVAAHKEGRVIDVNNGLNGEGPFSPERSGGLTTLDISKLCFSGNYSFNEIKQMIVGSGGLIAYLGTNSVIEIEERINSGDNKALEVLEAMCYQVAKEVGAMAVVLGGEVDSIILTGGIAYSSLVTDLIKKRVSFLAPVNIYPGENELEALALNGLRVLRGEARVLSYSKLISG
ncbi:butyrate kinase [Thiospirochaeta perfilievii]|uniref:Probable butyrate kinase n=1 Tax=Thiospirochaeta perfilievii TaxID=252967 RepID=A0A5C1QB73_9SPIO|nr:butyrate kinase [Thiospirochaeta perfilievii]QEN05373.1 butyrate kinase [Thiospirochaeta perfilievii]